jgi:hypothetical protein
MFSLKRPVCWDVNTNCHTCTKNRRMNHHDDINWPKNEIVYVSSTWAKSYFGWASLVYLSAYLLTGCVLTYPRPEEESWPWRLSSRWHWTTGSVHSLGVTARWRHAVSKYFDKTRQAMYCTDDILFMCICVNTSSDNNAMRLVPKKNFILFIHQLQYGQLQSTSLVPAHTFSSGTAIACTCSIAGTNFVGCRLRPALQIFTCLLLTQNGVPFLTFWNKTK